MLAYQLQVGVGDTVTVMIPDSASAGGAIVPRLANFEVAGTFEVGLQEHDSVLALVNLADAEALRGLAGPTGIQLKFQDVLKAPELARAALARLPGGYQVRDWTQENEAYFRAIRIEKTMMGLILMLIVAVAAVQHRGDAGHGGERQAHRYRHPAHAGHEAARQSSRCS